MDRIQKCTLRVAISCCLKSFKIPYGFLGGCGGFLYSDKGYCLEAVVKLCVSTVPELMTMLNALAQEEQVDLVQMGLMIAIERQYQLEGLNTVGTGPGYITDLKIGLFIGLASKRTVQIVVYLGSLALPYRSTSKISWTEGISAALFCGVQ